MKVHRDGKAAFKVLSVSIITLVGDPPVELLPNFRPYLLKYERGKPNHSTGRDATLSGEHLFLQNNMNSCP